MNAVLGGGQSKFNFTKARLKGTLAELGEAFEQHFDGIVEGLGREKEVGKKGALGVGFEERVEVVAAGPGVALELGEEAVEESASGVGAVDPRVGEAAAERFAEVFVEEDDEEEVALGRVGGGGGRESVGVVGRGQRGGGVGAGGAGIEGGKVASEGEGIEAEVAGGFVEEFGAGDFGFGGGDDVKKGLSSAGFFLGAGGGGGREEGLAGEGHSGAGVAAHLGVTGEALFEKEKIGIELTVAGGGEKADFEAGFEGEGKETEGGFLAGGVAVEEALDLGVVAAEKGELAVGDGGALGGDGGFEADTPSAEGVELAFDKDKGVVGSGDGAGAVEVKEEVAFGEDGGLGRVDVFGLASGVIGRGKLGLAGGEGDDTALMVADGNHEATAETGAQGAEGGDGVVAEEEQAAGAKSVFGVFLFEEGGGEARVGGGGGADFKFVGQFRGKVAGLGPVAAHPVASGIGGTEGVMIVGGGGLVEIKEFLAERAFLAGGAAALLVFEGDLETLGEGLDGLDKAEALGLADESDEVPGFAAAKALVDAHVGVDVERRGFFAVEGAEAFVAWAGLFKGDDPANDIDDADAGAQIADTGGFKEGHGRARGARGLSGKI